WTCHDISTDPLPSELQDHRTFHNHRDRVGGISTSTGPENYWTRDLIPISLGPENASSDVKLVLPRVTCSSKMHQSWDSVVARRVTTPSAFTVTRPFASLAHATPVAGTAIL